MTHCGKIYDRFTYPGYEPFVDFEIPHTRFNGAKDILSIRRNVTRERTFRTCSRVISRDEKKGKARLSRVMSNCTTIESLAQVVVTYTERSALYYIRRHRAREPVLVRAYIHTYSLPDRIMYPKREGGAEPVVETRTTRVHHVMYISRRGRIEREQTGKKRKGVGEGRER